MTTQELKFNEETANGLALIDAGFRPVWPLFRRLFLWFHNYKPVKNIWFMKGITKRKQIISMNPTMQGTLRGNCILLEINGVLWIKHLKNG